MAVTHRHSGKPRIAGRRSGTKLGTKRSSVRLMQEVCMVSTWNEADILACLLLWGNCVHCASIGLSPPPTAPACMQCPDNGRMHSPAALYADTREHTAGWLLAGGCSLFGCIPRSFHPTPCPSPCSPPTPSYPILSSDVLFFSVRCLVVSDCRDPKVSLHHLHATYLELFFCPCVSSEFPFSSTASAVSPSSARRAPAPLHSTPLHSTPWTTPRVASPNQLHHCRFDRIESINPIRRIPVVSPFAVLSWPPKCT